ncbi:hypothetical protein Pint_03845 [Pistacia integerrima]|uniref:Uncharacterized protein n=1 Tax=Pistacia integerrima TaxID=434235 RepID=A0ACC0Z464_9ROSI|nr:hypothetical protein Pint_03845 [Pistacia integerrima]
MASSTGEVPVFTDTNLGTHIAMAVSPDITTGDFKRELAKTHFSCFPKIGEIEVYGLMVHPLFGEAEVKFLPSARFSPCKVCIPESERNMVSSYGSKAFDWFG